MTASTAKIIKRAEGVTNENEPLSCLHLYYFKTT